MFRTTPIGIIRGCESDQLCRLLQKFVAERVVRLALALVAVTALLSCAHGGGVVYPSPGVSDGDASAVRVHRAADADTPPIKHNQATAAGGAVVVPNPADLVIANSPHVHHAVDLVSAQSVVVTASPGGWPVVIHNDAELLDRDGCAAVTLAPEGDTRLTLILPEPGIETRSRFYLVGCGAGEATLWIRSEGELLNTYDFEVAGPG